MKKFKQGLLIGLICFLAFFVRTPALAQQTEMETNEEMGTPPKEETIEARISKILEEKNIKIPPMDQEQSYQKLELMGLNGSKEGKTFIVENGNLPVAKIQKYKIGDEIVLTVTKDMEGKELIYITDNVRRRPLYYLFVVFVILTVLIARWQGLTSLIGMAVSFGVIFMIILPNIASMVLRLWGAI